MNINNNNFRRALIIFSIFYILLMFTTVEYLQASYSRNNQANERQYLSQQLALIRTNIESVIDTNIAVVQSLSTLLTFSADSTIKEWQQIAPIFYAKATNIQNLSIAPNDVIAYVYPLTGNELAIGIDFRDTSSQWPSIEKIRQSKKLYIDGPLKLIQGGDAIIGRMPIYFDPPFNQEYWGHCSVVIKLNELIKNTLQDTELDNLTQNYHIVIGTHKNNRIKPLFGDIATFENPLAKDKIHINDQVWNIAVNKKEVPINLMTQLQTQAGRIIGYAVFILFFIALSLLIKAYRLAKMVSLQDPLTKLPNRRYAISTLERLIQDQPSSTTFSIFNIDINDFKFINDTYGHAAGDAVLIEVGKRLSSALRASDIVARMGGDEILVIIPRVAQWNELTTIANKIHQECDTDFLFKEHKLSITLSLGSASYPEQAKTIPAMLHIADQAMYLDKQRHKRNKL